MQVAKFRNVCTPQTNIWTIVLPEIYTAIDNSQLYRIVIFYNIFAVNVGISMRINDHLKYQQYYIRKPYSMKGYVIHVLYL